MALVLALVSGCGHGGGPGPGGGGTGGGDGGGEEIDPGLVPDLEKSEFRVTPAFGTPADGQASVSIELRLNSLLGHPIGGATVALEISGCGNLWQPLPPTDVEGRTSGTLASLAGEEKTVRASTESGGRHTEFEPMTTEFLLIPPQTYFVRASGADGNSGRSPLEAWATLAHAFAQVGAGATIHVGAGDYAGPLELALDSSATPPFVLSGDRAGTMTGDAGEVVIEAAGSAWALRLFAAHHAVLQGLTLRGSAAGLLVSDSRDVRVLACRAEENDTGVRVVGADDFVLQDCRLSTNLLEGLSLEGVRRARIESNLVYANRGEGFVLRVPSEDTRIRYNTFYRNEGNHLREETPGGTGIIEENILSEGGGEALLLQPSSGYQTSVNLLWQNAQRGPSRDTPDGSFEADPLLADPFGPDGILGGRGSDDDDFRLLPASVAIDVGTHQARAIVLGSHESLVTRTTRTDERAEESGDDLALTNLGYHAPLPAAPFRSLPKEGGSIAHAAAAEARVLARAWDPEQPVLAEERLAPLFDRDVVFLEHRLSPLETREECLAVQVDAGPSGRILARNWDGRRWSEPALSPYVPDLPERFALTRAFDLEYEALSGRALLVCADGDGIPSYTVLERGAWSELRAVADSALGEGNVRWVEVVPHPGTNELALVTVDDQRDLVVYLWNGSAFEPGRLLEENTLVRPSWKPFDAAFESHSGDLLVTWGFSVFAEETRWATLERASGEWRTGQHPSTDAVGAYIVLAADPISDRVAAVMGEGDLDNDVIVSVWTGAEWVHTAELTEAGPIENRLLEVEWIGSSGVACAVFRRQGHTGSFNIALFLPTGWRIQPDVVLSGVDKAAKVVLANIVDRNQLLGCVLDERGNLFGLRLEGRTFSLLNGGEPLMAGFDPLAPGLPFDVAVAGRPAASAFFK